MAYIYRLKTTIRLTMLCLSGFEIYSRWVPLWYWAGKRKKDSFLAIGEGGGK